MQFKADEEQREMQKNMKMYQTEINKELNLLKKDEDREYDYDKMKEQNEELQYLKKLAEGDQEKMNQTRDKNMEGLLKLKNQEI